MQEPLDFDQGISVSQELPPETFDLAEYGFQDETPQEKTPVRLSENVPYLDETEKTEAIAFSEEEDFDDTDQRPTCIDFQEFFFDEAPAAENASPAAPIEMLPAQSAKRSFKEKWTDLWRRRKLFVVMDALLIMLAATALGGIIFFTGKILPFESYDKIMPNVYCAGVDLGGMTVEEAEKTISSIEQLPSYRLRLKLPDCEYVFEPKQSGRVINSRDAAQLAYAYGRSNTSAFGLYKAYQKAQASDHYVDIAVALQYSADDIRSQAITIYKETAVPATESSSAFDPDAHTVSVVLGNPGHKIDPQTIYNTVTDAFNRMTFDDIELEYEAVPIDLNQLMDVCTAAANEDAIAPQAPVVSANAEAHALDVTVGIQGWSTDAQTLYHAAKAAVDDGSYGTVTVEMTPIEPEGVDLTAAAEEISSDPTEPYYLNGTVYEGTPGYSLDWDAAVAQLSEVSYGQQLAIPLTEVLPARTAADVEAVLFRDQLSSYTTAHTGEAVRTNNLRLACNTINGTVLNPGEEFSFNNVVGERTSDKGYGTAIVYVGSESVEELGGGICQVASTMYNACLYAEMEITQREYHQFFVTYVPGGLDATVYYGSVDFCFRNNTEYPVRINASVSDGYVRISLDGTKTNDHVVELSSAQLSSTPYTTVYERSSKYYSGTETTTVTPYTGYVYEAYQYIYDGNGNLLETNYLGKSYYAKRDRVITIGTG